MIGAIMQGLNLIGNLGGKLIEDKDKRTEYAFKMQELAFRAMEVMLNTKTVPWVDATIKLMYACKTFIRPVGSTVMAGFAAYCAVKQIALPEYIQVMLYGAPVAWGASRHAEKKRKTEDWE